MKDTDEECIPVEGPGEAFSSSPPIEQANRELAADAPDPKSMWDRLEDALKAVTEASPLKLEVPQKRMGFDPSKVEWTAGELNAAKAADAIYELLKDGFDMSDIVGALPHLLPLFIYLQSPNHYMFADKMVDLGVMLKRDNDWLKAGFPAGLKPDDTQVENSDEQEAKDNRHKVE